MTYRFNKRQLEVSRTQRDIALDKLKLDLFELRYGILLAAKELIDYVLNRGELAQFDNDKMRSLYVKLDEARFFFNNDVVKFLQEIERTTEKRLEMMAERDRSNMDDTALWVKLADDLGNCDTHLRKMFDEIPQAFETSLRFDQLVTSAGR